MKKTEIKGGTSPYIYRDGIRINREDGPGVSEDYFAKCMKTGRLNGYDTEILEALYEQGYMSSHMLQLLLNKPYRSLQNRMAKLKRNGFLIRYYFEYVNGESGTEQTVKTAYFYGLGENVRELYSRFTSAPYRPVFNDTINVLKRLALNQFIVDCEIYEKPVTKRLEGFAVQTGDYIFKPGYAIVLPTLEGDTCFVPVVTRRENNWPEQLIPNLKVLLAAKMPAKATRLIPVVICEDMVHVVQVRKEIEKHEHIRNLTVAYAIDVAIGGGSVFDTLLFYSGDSEDGQPIFTTTSIK